jgi:hypothetical protein
LRLLKYVAVFGSLAVLLAGAATGGSTHGPAGIVPIFNPALQSKSSRCGGPSPCTPLRYHGGPVMHTNTNYAIFWKPNGYTSWDGGAPYSAGYKSTIGQFFTDLAAASGATSNVYGALTQYCDGAALEATDCAGLPAGNLITTSSTFGGSIDDTTAYPASGCADPEGLSSVCLTDAQISAEIQNVIAAHSLTANATTQFFMFLPRGTTTCFDTDPNDGCAYTFFCAYHYNVGSGANALIYGNMPYPRHFGFDLCENAANPQYPNGDQDADIALSITSHESNEAISDPEPPSGWYDEFDLTTGGENGDKCAYFYGATQGTNGSEFNQTINGHHYYLQLEWSNATTDCVETYTPVSGPAPIVSKTSPKAGVIGQPISISGKNLTGITAVKINGTAMTNIGPSNGKKFKATIGTGTTSGNLVVTTAGGDSNGVPFTVNPSQLPIVKSVPKTAHVGSPVKIGGKNFWGTSLVQINGTTCTGVVVTSATKLTCTVGVGTTSGTVAVTTPGGTGTSTKSVTIS